MRLSDIRDYVRQRGRVTVDDVAAHFECEPSAAEGMLDTLASRGLVSRLSCGGCGGAGGCAVAGPAVFGWSGNGGAGETYTCPSVPRFADR